MYRFMKISDLAVGSITIIMLFIFSPPIICAQDSKIISTSYTYTMGDNDTKADARRICFLEAKRLLLEIAGVYIEEITVMKDFKLTKNEIRAYSAALLKAEIVSEKITFNNSNMEITLTVQAEVVKSYLESKIKQIMENKDLANAIKRQQDQISQLEKDLKNIQIELKSENPEKVVISRRKRAKTFDKLSELEGIKFKISQATKLAITNLELGMTKGEVIGLIGEPRTKKYNDYNYGKVWVIFEDGVLSCIVKLEIYGKWSSCHTYRSLNSESVIK